MEAEEEQKKKIEFLFQFSHFSFSSFSFHSFRLWTVGYGTDVWTYGGGYFAYTPLLGSIVGAILGAFMVSSNDSVCGLSDSRRLSFFLSHSIADQYDAFIYTGSESPLNKQWGWSSVTFWRRFYKKKPKSIENPSSIEDGKYTKNEG